ncbi:MAG: OmpH family outer membrane protein [Pyrinomonadaceae bacterium]
MKTLRFITTGFVLALVLAVSAFAQTNGDGKLGLIDTRFFDNGKDGIAKYAVAMDSLEKEFAGDNTALQTMGTRIQTLEKEIRDLQEKAAQPNSPIKPETVSPKAEEYEKLTREFKFKQEDAKVRFERRQAVVLGPLNQDIGKAMQEFAKQKGYSLILDIAKIADSGLILALDGKANLTADFIKFYNTRPASAAATAVK